MKRTSIRLPVRALARDRSGLALLEFAFMLPVLLLLSLTGAEITNYITTKMRVSQLALQLADDAARMGSGSLLSAKTITETDINDLFTGSQLQSGELDLKTNGRVILTDLEPTTNPNSTPPTFKIGWQRCFGTKTSYVPLYTTATKTGLTGLGPAGHQVQVPNGNAAMFVEVYYAYTPLVKTSFSPTTYFVEYASMLVRDTRDLSRIYNTSNDTVSSC
ncbi:pilus assembly protein [Sphingomonas sp. RB3P16]|uniref:TadE/TadG family type IV pilus assembly protein n=1 Tax=Parasphingomonas frigoris TaxID=3096163 RepID=UPI002FC58AD7